MSLLILLRPLVADAGTPQPDPFPATFTIQESGHQATIRSAGHTATLREQR